MGVGEDRGTGDDLWVTPGAGSSRAGRGEHEGPRASRAGGWV